MQSNQKKATRWRGERRKKKKQEKQQQQGQEMTWGIYVLSTSRQIVCRSSSSWKKRFHGFCRQEESKQGHARTHMLTKPLKPDEVYDAIDSEWCNRVHGPSPKAQMQHTNAHKKFSYKYKNVRSVEQTTCNWLPGVIKSSKSLEAAEHFPQKYARANMQEIMSIWRRLSCAICGTLPFGGKLVPMYKLSKWILVVKFNVIAESTESKTRVCIFEGNIFGQLSEISVNCTLLQKKQCPHAGLLTSESSDSGSWTATPTLLVSRGSTKCWRMQKKNAKKDHQQQHKKCVW